MCSLGPVPSAWHSTCKSPPCRRACHWILWFLELRAFPWVSVPQPALLPHPGPGPGVI